MPNYNYPYTPQFYPQPAPPMPNVPPNVSQNMGPQQMQQQNAPQIQNGGFVSVRNEDEARGYPVAIGNSVTFKDETAPYVYTKTMGFSQLDRPIFEKYRLVKEEPNDQRPPEERMRRNPEIDTLKNDVRKMRDEMNEIKETLYRRTNQQRRDKNGES